MLLLAASMAILLALPAPAPEIWSLMEDSPQVTRLRGGESRMVLDLAERMPVKPRTVSLGFDAAQEPTWRLATALLDPDNRDNLYDVTTVPIPLGASAPRATLLKLGMGGTAQPVVVMAIHLDPEGVRVFTWWGSETASGPWRVLQDLDRDGTPEIVVCSFVGDYEGIYTRVDWPGIWRWDGTTWARADARFPRFYKRHVLPALRSLEGEARACGRRCNERQLEMQRKVAFTKTHLLGLLR